MPADLDQISISESDNAVERDGNCEFDFAWESGGV